MERQTSPQFSSEGTPPTVNDWEDRNSTMTRGPSRIEMHLSGLRLLAAMVVRSNAFNIAISVVIIANVIAMIFETDYNAPCALDDDVSRCRKVSLNVLNYVFLGIYTIEVLLRCFVERLQYFQSRWNLLDSVIVFTGYMDLSVTLISSVDMPGPSTSLLRIFRVLRLLRTFRVFKKVPELYGMLRGFVSAMQSMLWGFLMLVIMLLLWAVLSVELIHPISLEVHEKEDQCLAAFGSVWSCFLLFFQTLVAGDSWGECTVPIIKREMWTFIPFGGALVSVQLGFMNLILAVIVDRASAAKAEDVEEKMKERQKAQRKAAKKLAVIFSDIDVNGDGTISLAELFDGYDGNQDMQEHFAKMDLDKDDLAGLFEFLDEGSTGELSYECFMDELCTITAASERKQLMMLRLESNEIIRNCRAMLLSMSLAGQRAHRGSKCFPVKMGPRNSVDSREEHCSERNGTEATPQKAELNHTDAINDHWSSAVCRNDDDGHVLNGLKAGQQPGHQSQGVAMPEEIQTREIGEWMEDVSEQLNQRLREIQSSIAQLDMRRQGVAPPVETSPSTNQDLVCKPGWRGANCIPATSATPRRATTPRRDRPLRTPSASTRGLRRSLSPRTPPKSPHPGPLKSP